MLHYQATGVVPLHQMCHMDSSQDYVHVQGPYDWHPAPEKVKEACRKAAKACGEQGVSLRRLALQEAVKNSDMATQLVGMGSVQEVRSHTLRLNCMIQYVQHERDFVLKGRHDPAASQAYADTVWKAIGIHCVILCVLSGWFR